MDRVLTETEKVRKELTDKLYNLATEYGSVTWYADMPPEEQLITVKLSTLIDYLTDWYMERGNHWYDGYRQGYEKGKHGTTD